MMNKTELRALIRVMEFIKYGQSIYTPEYDKEFFNLLIDLRIEFENSEVTP